MFQLRFSESEVSNWALQYSYPRLGLDILERGFDGRAARMLTKRDLERIAQWKSPRRAGLIQNNSETFVEEVTAFAFAAKDERARIESLTLLEGVSWPTASVILHLFHSDPYPIMDFRALWSLSASVPAHYNFTFWWDYVETCRGLRVRCATDMRTLDKALWQYSKQHQPSRD